jgi:inosose dehydratase
MRAEVSSRVVAAPISWGVCEVPDWGFQLDRDDVLGQMATAGIGATEFGPDGFLPAEPAQLVELLGAFGLSAIGGFVPVVLHDPAHDPIPELERRAAYFAAIGASRLVLAAATGVDGYDDRPILDDEGWRVLMRNLDRAFETAASSGLVAALHPHVGTMVQTEAEIRRVMAGSAASLCLDTGHILVGGGDPIAIAADYAERIAHVHLKDVDATMAAAVAAHEYSYTDGVRQGLYTVLGEGDVDVASIVDSLERAGYRGYYVIERDVVLTGPQSDDRLVVEIRQAAELVTRLMER